ncbi:guanylate kinase [Hyphobacterium sp. CCMP332]|nr:guanylate kinase [Hyphobacterium sp. CCMP332]
MSKKGKLLIFSAPSGAGKTSIVKRILSKYPNIGFSISATSRNTIREGEQNGKDYYFLTLDEFKEKIKNEEFVEWEEVYENAFYGTLKSELERIWTEGRHVIFDIDVKGGLNIKKQYGDRALAIFVQPPSVQTLEERLKKRGSENDKSLQERINKAESEMKYASHFDVVIENDNLDHAVQEAEKYINKFLT